MMMDTLLAAGDRLADALRAENEALARLDLPGAAGVAGAKMRATDAFAGLGSDAMGGGGAAEAQWRPMLVDAIAGAASRAGHGLGVGPRDLISILQAIKAAGALQSELELR